MKAVAVTTANGVKFTSQTDNSSYEIKNAQENVLGSLAACEVAAIKALTKDGQFKVNSINFKKIESSYDLEKFKKGGKGNHFDEVNMEAEFDTNGTQEQLDDLLKKIQTHCPLYCLLTDAGVKINSKWVNVKK